MAFLTRVLPPRELVIQHLQGHDARIWVGACGDLLFPLSQHAHEFVGDIKLQYLVEGKQFDPVLSLLPVRRSEELNC